MGSHHPVGYFVESILNPDAVIVEGPGYASADGRSAMPAYGDITASELADVVAFLQSLSDPATTNAMHEDSGDASFVRQPLPAPPAGQEGASFLVHTYDPAPARLRELEGWFKVQALPALLASPGFVGVETYVDATRLRASLATVLRFRDDASLTTFLASPSGSVFTERFTELVGAHTSYMVRKPLVYRAPSLSMQEPRDAADAARTAASSFADAASDRSR